MRIYCVLLHAFAALLLCDYGLFSGTSPSPSEMPSTEISDTSGSYTTATTESGTAGNDSSSEEFASFTDDPEDDQSTETTLNDLPTTDSSKGYSAFNNESAIVVISSTAQPKEDPNRKGLGSNKEDSGSLTGGIIILILILILIVFLLGILYVLRKKGRSYSFDLTRVETASNDYVDTPLRTDQQGISYEQTNKDLCLDYVKEDKSEEKTNPIANGSAAEKTEQTPTNENDEQNFPEENSFSSDSSLTTPGYIKRVEFDLDLDLLGGGSDLNISTEAEATDTPQNENNNNVSNAGRGTAEEIFTEISLDEPK